jgi:hypothetical protein
MISKAFCRDPHLVATDFFPVVDHPSEGPIRSMKVSATWSDTPAEPARLAPRLNEHGAEILREAGFSADEIAALVRDGVTIATPSTPQRIETHGFRADRQPGIDPRRGAKDLRALRRRLLAEEGQGGRLSRRFPQGAGGCRLARHLHSREAYGGSGLGIVDAAIMMRTIAESGAGMSGASAVHINVFGLNPVVVFGTEEQCKRMLPPIVSTAHRRPALPSPNPTPASTPRS